MDDSTIDKINMHHTEVGSMAIEPLGSIMSMQAQGVQKVEPIKPNVESVGLHNTNVSGGFDPSISAVKAVDSKGENSNSEAENSDLFAKDQQLSHEKIKQAVDKINKNMHNSEVQFGIHEATHRVTIKIIDKDTKELIKELPPEKTLDMIAKAWELAGLLVDERR